MLNKLKHFKFQGLVMEVALVVFNVFLVLSLVYVWTNFFNADTGSGDKVENYRYVKATGDSTLVE